MWTLIVPLVIGSTVHPERMEWTAQYETREECHAARLELAERAKAPLLRRYSRTDPWEDARMRFEAADAVDQPPGVPEAWRYVDPETIGYCVNGPSSPDALAENRTGLSLNSAV